MCKDYLGLKSRGERPRLYRNLGDFRFEDAPAIVQRVRQFFARDGGNIPGPPAIDGLTPDHGVDTTSNLDIMSIPARRSMDDGRPATGHARPSRRSRKTSRDLIAAAGTVLAEAGVAGLTVRAVTARADVGHGTFYHHFTSAEDVLAAVVESSMHDLAEALTRQHSDARDKAWVMADSAARKMIEPHPTFCQMPENT